MNDATPTARIVINPDREIGRIDQAIYGHFLESGFFQNIEGGVFDEGSTRSIADPGPMQGMRIDVLEACRELGLPVVRWPGGNFTSPYHWEDGIGPRDNRPRRLNLAWGGEETNRFGTGEFLAWCAELGTEAYLAHSARNVDEAIRWVEYTNYRGDTELTRQRAHNGHPEGWNVPIWGVGNEVYGSWQMGYRPPEHYAADAREHAKFMRLVDPSIRIVAVGLEDESWTRPLLAAAGDQIDYVSQHLYGASMHLFSADSDAEFGAVVAQSVHFEREIRAYAHLVGTLAAEIGIDRPLALAIDEWNMRHLEPAAWPQPQPGPDGGIAPRETPVVDPRAPGKLRVSRYSPRTLADALFYAGVLHGFQRMSGLPVPPSMANTVNLVNANGLLAVRPDGLVRSATWHVWNLIQNHTGSVAIAADIVSPERWRAIRSAPHPPQGSDVFPMITATVPELDVSVTINPDGRALFVSVVNRSADYSIVTELVRSDPNGGLPPRARVRQLGADIDELFAVNLISAPDQVVVRDLGEIALVDGCISFPAHSITVCEFALDKTPPP